MVRSVLLLHRTLSPDLLVATGRVLARERIKHQHADAK